MTWQSCQLREKSKKLSKLDTEISKASSPVSTNITRVILCLARKGIYLPPERCPSSCVKGPTLLWTIPHKEHHEAQTTTSKAHLPASFQQTRVTRPQTSPFPENKCQRQCKEQLKVSSCPREHACHQKPFLSRAIRVIWMYCVSKYCWLWRSRLKTSPSYTQGPIL